MVCIVINQVASRPIPDNKTVSVKIEDVVEWNSMDCSDIPKGMSYSNEDQ